MKKILIALALCLVAVGLMAAPVLAATQKVVLTRFPGVTAGYATFTTNQGDRALVVGITVTNATAKTKYGIYLQDGCALNITLGCLTTNGKGKWGGQDEQYQFEKVLPVGNYTVNLVLTPVRNGTEDWHPKSLIKSPDVTFNIAGN